MKVSASSSRGPTNPLLRFGDLSGTLLRVPRAGKPLRFAGLALRNVLWLILAKSASPLPHRPKFYDLEIGLEHLVDALRVQLPLRDPLLPWLRRH